MFAKCQCSDFGNAIEAVRIGVFFSVYIFAEKFVALQLPTFATQSATTKLMHRSNFAALFDHLIGQQ